MNKKKTLSAFILLFMLLQCFWIGHPQKISAAANLLINGSAEEGLKGWNDPQEAWGNNIGSTGHNATHGNAFFWPSRKCIAATCIYQDVNVKGVTAGTYFQLTGQLANYDQSPHDQASLILQFLDANGKVLSSDKGVQRNPKWNKHIITLPVPSGATTARVILQADRFVGNDNDAYFDNIVLTKLTGNVNKVYITGSKSKGTPGEKIQLSASDGVYKKATDYLWSSSYDAIATVDQNGLVTFAKNMDSSLLGKEVVIYAKNKKTGIVGHYYFNSTTPNEKPVSTTTVQPVSGFGIKKATISWPKVSSATGYKVYVYENNTAKLLKTFKGHKTLKYTISFPAGENERTYLVYSYKGNSKKALETRFTSVTLSWKKQSKATGYRIYKYDSKTKKYKLEKTISNVNTTSYTVSGLKANTSYSYKICAYKKVSGKYIESKLSSSLSFANN